MSGIRNNWLICKLDSSSCDYTMIYLQLPVSYVFAKLSLQNLLQKSHEVQKENTHCTQGKSCVQMCNFLKEIML